jgi:Raf kinase inhibitor-like YbhB/YbcL family protein
MTLQLTSKAFADGDSIPQVHTCDGRDISPPLAWSGAPAGCRSFALLCDDPDAPAGTWHHWAVHDIPPTQTSLPERMKAIAQTGAIRQAVNDFGRVGYGGPCPPRGHGPHHYRFRLLALSVDRLDLPEGAQCADVAEAAQRHKLAEATLTGIYER